MMEQTSIGAAARQVYLLGGLRVLGPRGAIYLSPGKVQSLFACLLLSPAARQTRDHLAALFWPDAAPARAWRNLSDLIYRLRKSLGKGWLVREAATLALRTGDDLWVDVWAFERLCQTGEIHHLEEAVALYAGDLLPGIYDEWVLLPRLSLRETYLTSLLKLGESAERNSQPEQAADYYRRLVQAEPLREDARRGLMRSLARLGRLAEALNTYSELEQVLQRELNIGPSPESQALAGQLRREPTLPARDSQQSTILREGDWSSTAQSVLPPFVGRVAERARLLTFLEMAQAGQGGMVVILGEAGIGKTRLLEELAQAADWRGWQVVWGRSREFTHPSAYSPLFQALETALPTPRIQQLALLVSRTWLAIAGRLLPALQAILTLPDVSSLTPAEAPLSLALARLLDGLQQIAPHLILLDDAQWADPALWSLLEELRPLLDTLRILLVIAGRTDECRAQPVAWQAITSWDRAGVPVLPLTGLASDELRALVADRLEGQQLSRLAQVSGGNPLLALTLIESGDLSGQPTLLELTRQRLSRLPAPAVLALQAAAVVGYQFDFPLWTAVLDVVSPADLPGLAGELEQSGLIVLETDDYRFVHDTLRACVYMDMLPEQRQQLHRKALAAMVRRRSENTLALLYHAEQAGLDEQVARYALQAGQAALQGFNYPAAFKHFDRALASLPPDDLPARYAAALGRVQALSVLADRQEHEKALRLLESLANQMVDPHRQAEVAYQQAIFHWSMGAYAAAQAATEHGLALARQVGDQVRVAALLETLGRIVREQGHYTQAQTLVAQARETYQALGHALGEASTTDLLGGLAWQMGDYQTAVAQHTAAADQFEQIGDIFRQGQALNNLGTALWSVGDYARARVTHERALVISREVGHRRGEADNLDNLGGVAWIIGDYQTAIQFYKHALAIRRDINDKWGVSISLGNLGSAYRLLGQTEEALTCYAEALELNQAIGRRRGEGFVQHGRGLTLLEAGQTAEAHEALVAAHAIRTELEERDTLIETVAGLALVCLTSGDIDQAQIYLQQALPALEPARDRASLQQWVHFVAYRIFSSVGQSSAALFHLREANAAMLTIAKTLTPDDRVYFLQHVPLNREIQAALDAHAQIMQVRLVHIGTPLGRKLRDADYVTVTWTLYTPADDIIPDPADRRRHVLQRLLAEAAEQNATPTDDDLAHALGVSRRTVLRDMAMLAEQGEILPTRRRSKSQA